MFPSHLKAIRSRALLDPELMFCRKIADSDNPIRICHADHHGTIRVLPGFSFGSVFLHHAEAEFGSGSPGTGSSVFICLADLKICCFCRHRKLKTRNRIFRTSRKQPLGMIRPRVEQDPILHCLPFFRFSPEGQNCIAKRWIFDLQQQLICLGNHRKTRMRFFGFFREMCQHAMVIIQFQRHGVDHSIGTDSILALRKGRNRIIRLRKVQNPVHDRIQILSSFCSFTRPKIRTAAET